MVTNTSIEGFDMNIVSGHRNVFLNCGKTFFCCITSNGHCEKSVRGQIARLVPSTYTFVIIVQWQAGESEGTKSFRVHKSKSAAIQDGTTGCCCFF